MHSESIVYSIFMIFTGAAIFATLALYARQALLIAYIALGLLVGPHALQLVSDAAVIRDIAEVGIIFLLFLLGLNLEPGDLGKLMREAVLVTLLSSLAFAAIGVAIGLAFGFGLADSLLMGVAMMFSSTIIGLKLLPTSALHHQRMGEIIVSVLLLQDVIAILVLMLLEGAGKGGDPWSEIGVLVLALPLLAVASWYLSKELLTRLILRFDQIQEYLFLLAIGWCLGVAEIAERLGASYEIGAFIAGVSLATNPVSRFIAESLKPLRDFFLIMFFFALGAGFPLDIIPQVILPAAALALAALLLKPLVFRELLKREKEKARMSSEIGVRLAPLSEFSLLIAVVGVEARVFSETASFLVQTAIILTFVASSYWIVMRYPTPIAVSDRLRRD